MYSERKSPSEEVEKTILLLFSLYLVDCFNIMVRTLIHNPYDHGGTGVFSSGYPKIRGQQVSGRTLYSATISLRPECSNKPGMFCLSVKISALFTQRFKDGTFVIARIAQTMTGSQSEDGDCDPVVFLRHWKKLFQHTDIAGVEVSNIPNAVFHHCQSGQTESKCKAAVLRCINFAVL